MAIKTLIHEFELKGTTYGITQDEGRHTTSFRIHRKGIDSLGNKSWTQEMCTHPTNMHKIAENITENHLIHAVFVELIAIKKNLKN